MLNLRIDGDSDTLKFVDDGFCSEMDHLAIKGKKNDKNAVLKMQAVELYKECNNISQVARELKIAKSTAKLWIDEFKIKSNETNESNETNISNESNESNISNETPF